MNDNYNDIINILKRFQSIDTSEMQNNIIKIIKSYDGKAESKNQMNKLRNNFNDLSKNLYNLAEFIDKKFK